jgi:hypothetical protein
MAASRRPSKRRTSRRCSRRLATCRCCVDERRGEPAALLRVSAGSLSVTLAVKAVEPDGVAKASPESQSRPRPYGSCTLAADGVAEIPPYGPGAGRHHPGRYGVELRGPVLRRHRRRDEARQQEHVVARVQRFVRKPETTSSYRASRPSPHARLAAGKDLAAAREAGSTPACALPPSRVRPAASSPGLHRAAAGNEYTSGSEGVPFGNR